MEVLGLIDNDKKNKRPFQCSWDTCSKSFSRRSDLQRHYRIHTNERPYRCSTPGCRKSFNQKGALTVHLRTHTGEKPHKCQNIGCGKEFSDVSTLARHRRTHTSKRPYNCAHSGCPKKSCSKLTMLEHQRKFQQDGLSHNEMPNNCTIDTDGRCKPPPAPSHSSLSCPGTASQPFPSSGQSMTSVNLLVDLAQHMSQRMSSQGHTQQRNAGEDDEDDEGHSASSDNRQRNMQVEEPMATKSSDFGVIESNYAAAKILADFHQARFPWQSLGQTAFAYPYTSGGICVRSGAGGFRPASGDCADLLEGMPTHPAPQTRRCDVQSTSPIDTQYSVVEWMQQTPETASSQVSLRPSHQSAVDQYPDSAAFMAEDRGQCQPLVEVVTASELPPFGSAEWQGFYDGLRVELDDCVVVSPSTPTEAV